MVSSIERLFEIIKYAYYPQKYDSDNLTIEYEKMLFTKWPIGCLTDNSAEMLEVSSNKWSFDNKIYESNR